MKSLKGFSNGSVVKKICLQFRKHRRGGFNPCVGEMEGEMATLSSILVWKIPWTEEPPGYSPWGHKESNTTERLSTRACMKTLHPSNPSPPTKHPGKGHSQDWSPGFLAWAQEQAGVGAAALAPGATRQSLCSPQPSRKQAVVPERTR